MEVENVEEKGVEFMPTKLTITDENRDVIVRRFPVFERLNTLLDITGPITRSEQGRQIYDALRAFFQNIAKGERV